MHSKRPSGIMTFRVTNRKTDNSFEVGPQETVLDAASRQGHGFAYSCRSGSCGSCKARLISGQIEPITASEQALSSTDVESGQILLCQARPQSDLVIEAVELPAGSSIPIRTLPCRLAKLELLCHDVMQMTLKLPQNQTFQYLPGQYIDILLRDGRRRSFSIANAQSAETDLELHVRLVPGGHFTQQVFGSLKERDLLRFQGPFGTFFLRESDPGVTLLVAGGTGLAPIKAMLEAAFASGSTRTFQLFWGVREERDLYGQAMLERWSSRYDNFQYVPVLSDASADSDWSGETGWVHEAVIRRFPDLSRAEVYASGPPPMIEALKSAVASAGLTEGQLFYDSFEYASDSQGSMST